MQAQICLPMGMTSIAPGKMYETNCNAAWKMKSQFIIPDIFICMLDFTWVAIFIYGINLYIFKCYFYTCM